MTQIYCHELVDLLSKADTVDAIHSACSALCDQFGFDRFQYAARLPTPSAKPYYIFIGNYQDEWRKRYFAKGYMSIDPVVTHCVNHMTPYSWEQITPLEQDHKIFRDFMGEAREFSLNSGVSFPIHSPHGEFAIFNVTSRLGPEHTHSQISEATPFIHFFTACLHESVREIFKQQMLSLKKVPLIDRERECLLWVSEGKTTWVPQKLSACPRIR